MKKFRIILTFILCLVPFGVQAQNEDEYKTHVVKWYEDLKSIANTYQVDPQDIIDFNDLKSEILTRRQELKIPLRKIKKAISDAGTVVQNTAQQAAEQLDSMSVTVGGLVKDALSSIFSKQTNKVNAALILPFSTQNGINGSNYDFYSGVLMAVRDMASQGISVDLNVFDMPGSTNPASREALNNADIIIGPLSTKNITTVLEDCPFNKYIISPLDSRAAALAEAGENVIQAPSSTDAQYADLISWIKEEHGGSDKLILFTEKNATPTALAKYVESSGIKYSTVNYGILEGRNIANTLQSIMNPDAVNRVVIASDNEAFVNDVVRNLNLMTFKKYNVVLFGPSKIRNFETIEVENFHNTHLHMSSSYYVDYNDSAVKSFLMAYRALFNAEPGPYAFQGYDTAKFFLSQYANHSNGWISHLESEKGYGLQSNFLLKRTLGGGYVNQAVRRVVYDTDWSINLLK